MPAKTKTYWTNQSKVQESETIKRDGIASHSEILRNRAKLRQYRRKRLNSVKHDGNVTRSDFKLEEFSAINTTINNFIRELGLYMVGKRIQYVIIVKQSV